MLTQRKGPKPTEGAIESKEEKVPAPRRKGKPTKSAYRGKGKPVKPAEAYPTELYKRFLFPLAGEEKELSILKVTHGPFKGRFYIKAPQFYGMCGFDSNNQSSLLLVPLTTKQTKKTMLPEGSVLLLIDPELRKANHVVNGILVSEERPLKKILSLMKRKCSDPSRRIKRRTCAVICEILLDALDSNELLAPPGIEHTEEPAVSAAPAPVGASTSSSSSSSMIMRELLKAAREPAAPSRPSLKIQTEPTPFVSKFTGSSLPSCLLKRDRDFDDDVFYQDLDPTAAKARKIP